MTRYKRVYSKCMFCGIWSLFRVLRFDGKVLLGRAWASPTLAHWWCSALVYACWERTLSEWLTFAGALVPRLSRHCLGTSFHMPDLRCGVSKLGKRHRIRDLRKPVRVTQPRQQVWRDRLVQRVRCKGQYGWGSRAGERETWLQCQR